MLNSKIFKSLEGLDVYVQTRVIAEALKLSCEAHIWSEEEGPEHDANVAYMMTKFLEQAKADLNV